jgi:hypothetical protein
LEEEHERLLLRLPAKGQRAYRDNRRQAMRETGAVKYQFPPVIEPGNEAGVRAEWLGHGGAGARVAGARVGAGGGIGAEGGTEAGGSIGADGDVGPEGGLQADDGIWAGGGIGADRGPGADAGGMGADDDSGTERGVGVCGGIGADDCLGAEGEEGLADEAAAGRARRKRRRANPCAGEGEAVWMLDSLK